MFPAGCTSSHGELAPSAHRLLYVPYDHGLLTEITDNHLDWPRHLARVRP